ncbi:MAG: 7-carboxy-7-deazaguanine synthase [Burkholderiales bacterium]|nr:7-carboxy-7-deazaguanine synthase [Burkholderiales bacterium]MDE2457270.1 7-carboxy-7-deazaguanine synthase [Burkholderiales bacterium]
MTYSVKEIFYTLQGEGRRAGRPAVFCRFAGCNLWSGREQDREQAICRFCDTDFVGTDGTLGGKFEGAAALAAVVAGLWPAGEGHRYVVLTGGEPLLQVDAALIDALHGARFEIAVETNGSVEAPAGLDWICVSPKAGAPWVQRRGNELKLAYPQPGLLPDAVAAVATDFEHYLIQPIDSPLRARNTRQAIAWCQAHPRWNLSVQTHKVLDIR